MTKREVLKAKISANTEKIKALKSENFELQKQDLLLSDEKQWFVEKEEELF